MKNNTMNISFLKEAHSLIVIYAVNKCKFPECKPIVKKV